MKKIYIGEIKDEDTDELLTRITAYSEESFLEEMGKTKWIKFSQTGLPNELNNDKENNENLIDVPVEDVTKNLNK